MPPEEMVVYLKGKVVDVTKFQRSHPGGAKALRIFKDRDATEQFEMCARAAASGVEGPLSLARATPLSARAALSHPGTTPLPHRYHSPAAHKKLDLMMKNAPDAPTASGVHTTKLGVNFKQLDDKLHEAGLY